MIRWIFILAMVYSPVGSAQDLLGAWKYNHFIYDGVHYPPSNPNMELTFKFTKEGVSILKWSYKDDGSFCERGAIYQVSEDHWLYQKNVWVNQNNHMSCGSDPDMQLGRESRTHFSIQNHQLHLELELAGKPYVYVLDLLDTE